jgi:hypothetical protein
LGEIENCIANKLAGAMESSLSTTVDLNDLMREMVVDSQARFVTSPADCVNWSMLEEKNGVPNFLISATLHKVFLKNPNLLKI